jgi:hypothetical protein
VAAREDEPQPVVARGGHEPLELGQFGSVVALAAQRVEATVAGDREQPGVRPIRDAFNRPPLNTTPPRNFFASSSALVRCSRSFDTFELLRGLGIVRGPPMTPRMLRAMRDAPFSDACSP